MVHVEKTFLLSQKAIFKADFPQNIGHVPGEVWMPDLKNQNDFKHINNTLFIRHSKGLECA